MARANGIKKASLKLDAEDIEVRLWERQHVRQSNIAYGSCDDWMDVSKQKCSTITISAHCLTIRCQVSNSR